MDDFSYCLELLNSDDEAAAHAALFAAAPPPPATADPQMDGAITAAAFNLPPPPPLPLSDNPSNTSPAPLFDPLPPVDFVGLTPPLVAPPRVDGQVLADAFFASHQNPTYLSPASDPLDPNWEAIGSYLVGQVRPGPDVTRVYKCERCGLEFPNAQAFGGHMSSHSKARKGRSDSSAEAEAEGRALGVRSAGQGFKKAERSKRSKLSAKKKRTMATEEEANGFAGAAEGVSEELIYLESIDVDEEFSG